MNFGKQIDTCRMCESKDLYDFLDLGLMPPADGILSPEELNEPEILFPLKVCQCKNCGLTQLKYVVNPELLYGDKYRYESSITKTGVKHFKEMAYAIAERFNFPSNSLAVDIGSNVGVLLEGFKEKGFRVLGIDPAPKIARIANERGIETWPEFISSAVAERILASKGKAKVITATNVFAHIDDKETLMRCVSHLLDDDGIFVVEAPYLVDLIDKLEYDTIYLDHLEYTSVRPLINFFNKSGMEVFDVELYEIHGSSLRIFVSKKGRRDITANVQKFLDIEEQKGIYKKEVLDNFAENVKNHKKVFLELLHDLKKKNKKVVGISAPAKGNTLLNYCKIDNHLVEYTTEKSIIKQGNYTPGMRIPIHGDEKLLQDDAHYGVILAWNFAKEIMENNKEFLKKGGKFIIPIPQPMIMDETELFGVKIEKIKPAFEDERGAISDILNTKVNHVGLITNEVGAVRANHYHNLSTQYSYILTGKFEVSLAKADNPSNIKKVILQAGDLITIPPRVIHKFKTIERAIMIDIVSESREGTKYEDDVVRVKIEEDIK